MGGKVTEIFFRGSFSYILYLCALWRLYISRNGGSFVITLASTLFALD